MKNSNMDPFEELAQKYSTRNHPGFVFSNVVGDETNVLATSTFAPFITVEITKFDDSQKAIDLCKEFRSNKQIASYFLNEVSYVGKLLSIAQMPEAESFHETLQLIMEQTKKATYAYAKYQYSKNVLKTEGTAETVKTIFNDEEFKEVDGNRIIPEEKSNKKRNFFGLF